MMTIQVSLSKGLIAETRFFKGTLRDVLGKMRKSVIIEQRLHNPLGSVSIAIRIDGLGHFLVF